MNGVNTHNVPIAFAHEESHHSNRDYVILRQYENDENSIISIIENGKYTNRWNFSPHVFASQQSTTVFAKYSNILLYLHLLIWTMVIVARAYSGLVHSQWDTSLL